MKVITVQGFWAWAIAAGHKPVENRPWKTDYRGPLAIHCGISRKWDDNSLKFLRGLNLSPPAEIPRGRIIAVATLVDILEYEPPPSSPLLDRDERHPRLQTPHAFGPYCWCLDNPVALPRPIPYTGAVGLKDLALNIRNEVRKQIAEAT